MYLLDVCNPTNTMSTRNSETMNSSPNIASSSATPIHIQLTAGPQNVLNHIFPGDFNALALLAHRVGLGSTSHDAIFLCTFEWQLPSKHWRVTRAVLNVKMSANLPASNVKDPSAGDDRICMVRNAVNVPGYCEHVYSNWPFAVGQPAIKVWELTGVALSNLNIDSRLSFSVQDDTMVRSATLELWAHATTRQPK
jgi:hypothetical protein